MIQSHGLSKKDFHFFENDQQFMLIAARTPRSNCVLDVSKALAAGLRLRSVEEAIDCSLRQWQWEQA